MFEVGLSSVSAVAEYGGSPSYVGEIQIIRALSACQVREKYSSLRSSVQTSPYGVVFQVVPFQVSFFQLVVVVAAR